MSTVLVASLQGVTGILAGLLLIAGIVALIFVPESKLRWKRRIGATMVVAGAALLTVAFYATEVEIENSDRFLLQAKEHPDDADCGTKWDMWVPPGVGLANPCEKNVCYRGIARRKLMRMAHFPPTPEFRREFQCWVRKKPVIISQP